MHPEEKDLRQRTKEFALQIIRLFSELPKTTEAQVLGKQVLRSGTSVGANYREAYRARSRAEFIAKCGDSLRELEETAYWLELLVDGKIAPADKLSAARQECDELIAIFVTILKSSKELLIPNSYFILSLISAIFRALMAKRNWKSAPIPKFEAILWRTV
jgi:four helix bundle protein